MTLKKILVLAVILAGIAAYIFLYEIPKGKEKEKGELVLKGLEQQQIQSIEVIKGDRKVSLKDRTYKPVLEKKEGEKEDSGSSAAEWELARIPGAPLDYSTVQAMITPLMSLKLDTAVPKEEQDADLSVYGLKPPELAINVSSANGNSEIRFGKKNEFVSRRYFQVSGDDRVYMTSDMLFTAADKREIDFRKRNFVSFTDFEIRKATVEKNGGRLVIERQPEDKWKIIEPIKATAADEKLNELFRELRDFKADSFIDFKPEDASKVLQETRLDTPDMTASLEKKEGEPLVVKASELSEEGDESKKYTAFRAGNLPFAGRMDKSVLGRISLDPEDYREKKLFSFGLDVVKKAEIVRPGEEPLVLEFDKDVWKIGGNDADQTFVQQFLQNAGDVEAVRFPESSQDFGFDKPILKITLWTAKYGSDEKPAPMTLVVGSGTDDGYHAGTGDLSEPFIISKETLKNISPAKETLVPPKPTPAPPAAASPAVK